MFKQTSQKNLSVTRYTLNILKKDGLRGLYKGFMPALIGSFPGQFSYYVAYEYANENIGSFFKKFPFLAKQSMVLDGMATNAISGLVAEMVCGIAYLPTDIISQRLQIERKVDFRHVKYRHKNSIGKSPIKRFRCDKEYMEIRRNIRIFSGILRICFGLWS